MTTPRRQGRLEHVLQCAARWRRLRSPQVTGPCSVAFNANITINGNLTVSDGAVFAGFPSSVHVTGNVKVGQGALLGLGLPATQPTW